MHQAEVAHVLAAGHVGIGHQHPGARLDQLHGAAEIGAPAGQPVPDRLHLRHPDSEEEQQQDDEAPLHQPAAQIDADAGQHHEGDGHRQALVRHIGGESLARHGEIDRAADDQQRHQEGMNAHQLVPRRPQAGRHDDGGEREGHVVVIDADDPLDALDLALGLPVVLPGQAPGGAGQQQRHHGKEGQPASAEFREAGQQGLGAALPQAGELEGQDADAVDARRHQVAEEQHHDEQGGDAIAPRPGLVPQHHPGGQGEQGQADAEIIVHHPDEQHLVVEQRKDQQRNRRPAPEQGPVQGQGAAHDEGEAHEGIDLAGPVDRDQAHHGRHHHVHHQVGQDGPAQMVEARQVPIMGQGGDDVHARQVVHIVRERRQRVGQDRDRHQGEAHREDRGDDRERQIVRAPGPGGGASGGGGLVIGRRGGNELGVKGNGVGLRVHGGDSARRRAAPAQGAGGASSCRSGALRLPRS